MQRLMRAARHADGRSSHCWSDPAASQGSLFIPPCKTLQGPTRRRNHPTTPTTEAYTHLVGPEVDAALAHMRGGQQVLGRAQGQRGDGGAHSHHLQHASACKGGGTGMGPVGGWAGADGVQHGRSVSVWAGQEGRPACKEVRVGRRPLRITAKSLYTHAAHLGQQSVV